MAKKPTVKKKSAPRKKGARKSPGKKKNPKKKRNGGVFRKAAIFVFFAVTCLGIGAGYYLYTHNQVPEQIAEKVERPVKDRKFAKPDFEIFPSEPLPESRPEPVPIPPDSRPRVAIIIDDLGDDMQMAQNFLSIDERLTYAVLPKSEFLRQIAEAAHLKGSEVMLHLPMEPNEYPEVDPGPGALLSAMSPDERIKMLQENIDEIPYVSGINNHMGSKTTSDSAQMNQILSIVKKNGLFFIDSRTAADTCAKSSARLFRVPFAERDVFLDHEPIAENIREQILYLIKIAEKNGLAVGIGHPHPVTYEVLSEMMPEIKRKVQLIPASQVVRNEGL